MDTFPIVGDTLPLKTKGTPPYKKGDKLPDGSIAQQDIAAVQDVYYAGWLLFLDEFNSAPRSVQAAAYKLVLDRMVGQFKLHNNVKTVCAGNLLDDGAIVEELSTALQSRLVHLQLEISTEEWLDYANTANYDYRILAYIRNNPDKLYTFKADHSDHTYACPRTWEFANRLLKIVDIHSPNAITLFSGVLGDGVSAPFVQYSRMSANIPTLAQIELDPKGISVPNDPSVLFLVSSMMSQAMTTANADALYTYTKRLPPEFQVVTLRNAVKRDFNLFVQPSIQTWVNTDGKQYFTA